MFNTLVYIPTILAYTFITLLLVILGFIVIYVAHKIYITLYDYLPVAQLSVKSSLTQDESMTEPSDIQSLGTRADDQVGRKSKTALRIIVILEPCYLAYMVFESKLLATQDPLSRLYQISRGPARSTSISSALRDFQVTVENEKLLVKYFDSLASIPCGRVLKKCDDFKFNNLNTSRSSK